MIAHQRFTNKQAKERVIPMLQRVRIPAAKDRVRDYPHQFSGGMRQRAMIAMGVSNEPSLLIADEPTTALDVTVQASIIELLRDLSRELRAAVILITHNMALVASLCNRVIVMYAGRIVEEGPTRAIFKNPQHPYTWSLLRSMPRVDEVEKERLISIKGLPPDLGSVIVRLLPATSGSVFFRDTDLTKMRGEKLRRTRQEIQMIFQDPYASLNPRMTVGDIVAEPLRNFGLARGRKAEQKVQEMMR